MGIPKETEKEAALKSINDINDPRLVKALAHPLRVQILAQLQDRTASPSDLAVELGAPLGNVSYHVRILAKHGLIKLVKKRPRRGAIEHMYRASGPVRVSNRAWSQVPSIVKEAMIDASLEQAMRYAELGMVNGGFERPEAHMSRQPLRLDEQGWRDLADAVGDLIERADAIEQESQGRLSQDGGQESQLDAGLVMMLFEAAAAGADPVPAGDGAAVSDRR